MLSNPSRISIANSKTRQSRSGRIRFNDTPHDPNPTTINPAGAPSRNRLDHGLFSGSPD